MAFTNIKRKHADNTQGDKVFSKPQKRHRFDDAPSSSINNQAAGRPRKSKAELTSRPEQPIVAETPNSSADEALSLSLQKAKNKPTNTSNSPLVQEAIKQNQASGKTSGPSPSQAPIVEPPKLAKSEKVAPKQKGSKPEDYSLDEGKFSSAGLTHTGTNATSSTPSNAVGDRSHNEEDKEDRGDDGDHEMYSSKEEGEDSKPKDSRIQATGLKSESKEEERSQGSQPSSDSDPVSSSESSIERASDAASDSDDEPHADYRKKETSKADNPSAFASSMAGILGYKLTKTQRENPILARSADAKEADETLLDRKLERKAKTELKKEKLKKVGGADSGVKDGLGEGSGTTFGDDSLEGQGVVANQQREKELRKMAQKGVVKMFNAFASVRAKAVEAQGTVGSRAKKEEKATEMSKEGWLEFVGHGGKGKVEEMGKG